MAAIMQHRKAAQPNRACSDDEAWLAEKFPIAPPLREPTKCWHCRYTNGGRFAICPLCGKDQSLGFYRDDTGHIDSTAKDAR